jgi:hypothetical protein
MNLEKMIITALIIIAACICFLYPLYNRNNKDVADAEPDYHMLAKNLANEFHADKTEAGKKYLHKVIQVTGYLKEITHNNESMVILLKGSSPFINISCTLEHDVTFPLKTVTAGHLMIIRGECTGFLTDVTMIHCRIINQ